MTSNRAKMTASITRVKKNARDVKADPLTPLWALFPSAEQLKKAAAGAILNTGDQLNNGTGNRSASVEIPTTLLNPLVSLPSPLSLEDVRRLREGTASIGIQAT